MSLGKDDTQETSQTTQPWGPAQGPLKDILGAGGNLFRTGDEYLSGEFGPGNNLTNKSNLLLSDLLGGETLDVTSTPAWGSMVGGIQDAVNSQFSMAGRTGSPAHAGVMTSELGKLAGNLWDRERSRQFGIAPTLRTAGLDDRWGNLARYGTLTSGIAGLGGQTTSTAESGGFLGDLLSGVASIFGLAKGDEEPNIFSDGRSAAPYAQNILYGA